MFMSHTAHDPVSWRTTNIARKYAVTCGAP